MIFTDELNESVALISGESNYMNWVSLVIALLALVITYLNYLHTKKHAFANIIAVQRIDWIKDVRALIGQFIDQYLISHDVAELKKIKAKIDMYLNHTNPADQALYDQLQIYILKSDLSIDDLVTKSKPVLESAWLRMKLEAGSDKKKDQQIRDEVDKIMDKKSNGVKKMPQKLIIITGSPCVGKTTAAEILFEALDDSAYFDGDWAWCVNPFSIDDPRLRNGDKTMSFALSNYLDSGFEYVIFSSVVVIGGEIRENILRDITADGFEVIAFTLKCSEETLTARHRSRGDESEVLFRWLRMEPHTGDIVIDTDGKTPAQVADEMKMHILNELLEPL